MSIFEEILLEEYERSSRISKALEAELERLPRGSVRERSINGKSYYYLQYRDGAHVRSVYLRRDDVEHIRNQLARRKEVQEALAEQEKTRKQIVRALGEEPIREHAGA